MIDTKNKNSHLQQIMYDDHNIKQITMCNDLKNFIVDVDKKSGANRYIVLYNSQQDMKSFDPIVSIELSSNQEYYNSINKLTLNKFILISEDY